MSFQSYQRRIILKKLKSFRNITQINVKTKLYCVFVLCWCLQIWTQFLPTSANFPSVKYLSKELFPTVLSPIKINRNWYSNIGSTMLKIKYFNYKNFYFVKMFRKLLLSTPLLKAEDNFWSSFIFTLCEHQVFMAIWEIIFTMFEHITMATKQVKTNLFVNKPRNSWKLGNMWNNIGIFVMLLQKIIILVFLLREGYSICPGDTFLNLWVYVFLMERGEIGR